MAKRGRKMATVPIAEIPRAAGIGTNGSTASSDISADWSRRLPLAVLLILGISAVLSLLFALFVPLDANPDEKAHLDYIRLIIENHGFVQFIKGDPTRFESHQPPLYYLLCVPIYLLTSGNYVAVRLVNLPIQLFTIVIAFRAIRDLFPNRETLAIAVAAFVAFLPIQAQLSGAITNDPLTTLICTHLFWLMAKIVNDKQAGLNVFMVSRFFGTGIWTKLSVLQLLPALVVAYLLAIRNGKMTVMEVLKNYLLSLGTLLLVASPWLIRNTLLYGDPLTLKIYRDTGVNYTPQQIMDGSGWGVSGYIRNIGVRSFATFWYFLSPNLPFNRFVGDTVPLIIVLIIALAGIMGLYLGVKQKVIAPNEHSILLFFAAGLALLVPFFARFVLTVFQAQGRYFLPALLPAALLCCFGWMLLGKNERFAYLPAASLLILDGFQLTNGGFMP